MREETVFLRKAVCLDIERLLTVGQVSKVCQTQANPVGGSDKGILIDFWLLQEAINEGILWSYDVNS